MVNKDEYILVIYSRNRFQIRVITTRFFTAIIIIIIIRQLIRRRNMSIKSLQNTTNFVLYLHLFTTLNSLVALMYFRLHIHKSFNYS